MLITSARRFRESAYAFCTRYVPPDAMAASNKPHAKNTNGMPHESLTPIPQERLTFHPHAQQNAFRPRGARLQSRLFARWNQSLRHGPTPTGFAQIVSDDFPVLHLMSNVAPFRRIPWLSLTGFSAWARRRVFGSSDHSGADRTSDRAGAAQE
jgi:hypothetical protein